MIRLQKWTRLNGTNFRGANCLCQRLFGPKQVCDQPHCFKKALEEHYLRVVWVPSSPNCWNASSSILIPSICARIRIILKTYTKKITHDNSNFLPWALEHHKIIIPPHYKFKNIWRCSKDNVTVRHCLFTTHHTLHHHEEGHLQRILTWCKQWSAGEIYIKKVRRKPLLYPSWGHDWIQEWAKLDVRTIGPYSGQRQCFEQRKKPQEHRSNAMLHVGDIECCIQVK